MKLIILVAIVLVVLVLGGGAAYLTLFTPSPKQDAVVEEKEPERDPDDFVKLGKEELVSVAVRDMTKELSKKPALPTPEPAKKKSSGH